jgi:hypothetical protein
LSAIRPEASRLTTPKPSISESDAAREAGDHEQDLERGRRHAQGVGEGAGAERHPGILDRRPPAQGERQRQHGQHAQRADAEVRLAPADRLDRGLQERRPERPGQVIAARDDRDCDAAAPDEPERHVGDQRAERGRAAEHADQERLREHELPERGRAGRGDVADAEHERAKRSRHDDAEAVGKAAHQHAADREADHGRGIRQRGVGAVDPELGLDRGQGYDHRPQADAADRAERERGEQPPPGIRAVRPGGARGGAGARSQRVPPPGVQHRTDARPESLRAPEWRAAIQERRAGPDRRDRGAVSR